MLGIRSSFPFLSTLEWSLRTKRKLGLGGCWPVHPAPTRGFYKPSAPPLCCHSLPCASNPFSQIHMWACKEEHPVREEAKQHLGLLDSRASTDLAEIHMTIWEFLSHVVSHRLLGYRWGDLWQWGPTVCQLNVRGCSARVSVWDHEVCVCIWLMSWSLGSPGIPHFCFKCQDVILHGWGTFLPSVHHTFFTHRLRGFFM